MAFILRGFLRSKGKADQGKGTEEKTNRKAVVPTWKCYKTRSHILVNDVTVHEYKNPLSFICHMRPTKFAAFNGASNSTIRICKHDNRKGKRNLGATFWFLNYSRLTKFRYLTIYFVNDI